MTDSAPSDISAPVLNQASLATSAADWITNRILEGRIRPGQKVTEVGLAEQMGVSRSPVREALRALAREGLIIIEPRRGAAVAELDGRNAADLYDCRLLLEPHCTNLAVEAMDERRIDRLGDIFAQMRAAAAQHDAASYLLALKDYNLTLLDRCPNRMLFSVAESSWRASLRYWDLLVRGSENYLGRSLRRNRGMQGAVFARDPAEAERVATAVLEFGREELLKLLARLPPNKGPA